MTKNQKPEYQADARAISLAINGAALDRSMREVNKIPADGAAGVSSPATDACIARALEPRAKSAREVASCRKSIWFSFFFDGTGNNLEADVDYLKHSNVARLYRVHAENDESSGNFRIYVPGVGTYFREIGDSGGGMLGLVTGYRGQDRLEWALKEFDKKLRTQFASMSNRPDTIEEINVAAFGFSRGAALARAFLNLLIEKRCVSDTKNLYLKNGGYRLRIPFLGLFDTVASVGRAMSSNNTSKAGAAAGTIVKILTSRTHDPDYAETHPTKMAFYSAGHSGADPAPGKASGHDSWGAAMKISPLVEEVRHFVAAHEIRNSFPVESVSTFSNKKIYKPAHFYETVYPGVHSDVGGSYRPGEGARSGSPGQQLGLVPLRHMYDYAVARGVPLLPATAWQSHNKSDFEASSVLVNDYNGYIKSIGQSSSLGEVINNHMKLYFAWRFRHIRLKAKGSKSEEYAIWRSNTVYTSERRELQLIVNQSARAREISRKKVDFLEEKKKSLITNNVGAADAEAKIRKVNAEILAAKDEHEQTLDALLKHKAKLDSLPNMDRLNEMLTLYDQTLLNDAREIYNIYVHNGKVDRAKRANLRPHYRTMMDAYEAEYIYNKGLDDEKILNFFELYVHDSLAAFAKDATLPSDPRVVYLGGDEKYQCSTNNYMDLQKMRAGDA